MKGRSLMRRCELYALVGVLAVLMGTVLTSSEALAQGVGKIKGTLHVGSPTGAGLVGATVTCVTQTGTLTATTTTGGLYVLKNVPVGEQTLTFSKDGFKAPSGPPKTVVVPEGTAVLAGDDYLVKLPTVTLQINTTETTRSRTVTLNMTVKGKPTHYRAGESDDLSDAGEWSALTSAPEYTLQSSGNGLKTVYVQVRAAAGEGFESEIASDTITLKEKGGVTGRLYEGSTSGAVLADATVTCGGKTGTTTTEGLFTLTGIEIGTRELTFSKTGYFSKTISVDIVKDQNANAGDNFLIKILSYTYTPLLPAGWTYAEAWDINNSNTVLGLGFDSNDLYNAFTYAPGTYAYPSVAPITDIWYFSIADNGALLVDGLNALGLEKSFLFVGTTKRKLDPTADPTNWISFVPGTINPNMIGAINAESNVIGSGTNPDGVESAILYIYSSNSYVGLLPDDWSYSEAWKINSNSQVLGLGDDGTTYRFFIYSGGTYTEMTPPDHENLVQEYGDINNNGSVAFIAYDQDTESEYIFVYENNQYTEIQHTLTNLYSVNINDHGDLIVVTIDDLGISTSYLWSAGEFTELAPPGRTNVWAWTINNKGHVLLSAPDDVNGEVYFVYSAGDQYVEIAPDNWSGIWVNRINDNGAVVGMGFNQNGIGKAFLAMPQ